MSTKAKNWFTWRIFEYVMFSQICEACKANEWSHSANLYSPLAIIIWFTLIIVLFWRYSLLLPSSIPSTIYEYIFTYPNKIVITESVRIMKKHKIDLLGEIFLAIESFGSFKEYCRIFEIASIKLICSKQCCL